MRRAAGHLARLMIAVAVIVAAFAGCQRGAAQAPPSAALSAAEPFSRPAFDETIVVDSPLPGRDIEGDLPRVKLDALPGPDGQTTMMEALFAASNAPDRSFRIVLRPAGGAPIRLEATPPWTHPVVPPNVRIIESDTSGEPAMMVGPTDRRGEGLWVAAPRAPDQPLLIDRVHFRGFRASGLTIARAATGADVRVSRCTFERCERGIYQDAGRLAVRGCEFVESDLIGIKSVESELTVSDSEFRRIGLPRRTDHGAYAILLDRSLSAVIERCVFRETTGGPEIAWTIYVEGARHCEIRGNAFSRNEVVGEITGTANRDCSLSDNRFDSAMEP